MRSSSRRSDADADVIRRRLRLLLDERATSGGWVPDDPHEDPAAGNREEEYGHTFPLVAEQASGEGRLPDGIGRHRAPGPTARWDPGRSGARSLWAVALLAALALAGWTWWDRPRVEAADEHPVVSTAPASPTGGEAAAETSATVVVAVVGQVVTPGLVTLPAGSRVADAIAAAGGLLPEADPASANLAAVVADGEQVAIGGPGTAPAGGPAPSAPPGAPGGRLDLNTAGAADLDALPGIGPVLAQRIVDHRTRQGRFRSVEELDDVPGIGPAIAAELAELVTV